MLRISCLALVVVVGCWWDEPKPAAPVGGTALRVVEREDPARIAGRWHYRTQSNCGTVDGSGLVHFEWDAARRVYRERGEVHWSDSGTTIAWWGDAAYDARTRRLSGTFDNSLGDVVAGEWRFEGPERLVIAWRQTNGCFGEGIATR